jgi:stage III sporulation protein AD
MNILQIAAICITGAVLSLTLKREQPVFAMLVSAVAGLVVIFSLMSEVAELEAFLNELSELTQGGRVELIVKIIGITYVCVFTSSLCRDFGQSSIGDRIELFGKVIIILYAIPIVNELISKLTALLGG